MAHRHLRATPYAQDTIPTLPRDHRIEIMLTDKEARELYNLLGKVPFYPSPEAALQHRLSKLLLKALESP